LKYEGGGGMWKKMPRGRNRLPNRNWLEILVDTGRMVYMEGF